VGRWFVETDKGVRLYCEAVDERGPRFSYGPGNAVAVCPQWVDFSLYFHDEKNGEPLVNHEERAAWLQLVNATAMRGDASADTDPLAAFEKACKERAALATLKRLNVDVSGLQDPHGMWTHADKWTDR
jgi:hypothetical protein